MIYETQEQFNIKLEQKMLDDLGPDATIEEKLLWAQRLLELSNLYYIFFQQNGVQNDLSI